MVRSIAILVYMQPISLSPSAIPAERGNHTPEFAEAAATPAAHAAAMRITKALAVFGVKFLQKEVAMNRKVRWTRIHKSRFSPGICGLTSWPWQRIV